MPEHENYRSEFEAPLHAVVETKEVGLQVITSVVLDGEWVEFVADRSLQQEGKALEGKND